MKRSILEKRAVRTGIKASKKRGHVVSREELLDLRVQTLPAILRGALVLLGFLLIAACYFAWPTDGSGVRSLEAVSGIFAILFGAFGIRRTLSHVLDSMDAVDLANVIGEVIADALSNIDL